MSRNLYKEYNDKLDGEQEKVQQEKLITKREEGVTAIDEQVDTVNTLASEASLLKGIFEDAHDRAMDSNEMGESLSSASSLQIGVYILCLLIAIFLDWLMFGNYITWFLSSLGKPGWFIMLGGLVVPVFVVALEAVTSVKIHTANVDGNLLEAYAYRVFGVGLIFAFSSVTAVTFLTTQGIDAVWDMTLIEFLLTTPVVFISITVHSLVVFSGRLGHDAKTSVMLLKGRRHLRDQEKEYEDSSDKCMSGFRTALRMGRLQRNLYDENYEIPLEDFSDEAREIINLKAGRELIPAPDTAPLSNNGLASRTQTEPHPDEQEA